MAAIAKMRFVRLSWLLRDAPIAASSDDELVSMQVADSNSDEINVDSVSVSGAAVRSVGGDRAAQQ